MSIIALILFLVFCWGYGMNVIKLSRARMFDGLCALRVIGIFVAPMGVVLGFCN